jgi:hypothetical protein
MQRQQPHPVAQNATRVGHRLGFARATRTPAPTIACPYTGQHQVPPLRSLRSASVGMTKLLWVDEFSCNGNSPTLSHRTRQGWGTVSDLHGRGRRAYNCSSADRLDEFLMQRQQPHPVAQSATRMGHPRRRSESKVLAQPQLATSKCAKLGQWRRARYRQRLASLPVFAIAPGSRPGHSQCALATWSGRSPELRRGKAFPIRASRRMMKLAVFPQPAHF